MKFIAIIFILLAIMSALLIFIDTRRNPQAMKIMNAVWVLTGLWSGMLGLFAYYKFGREQIIPSPKSVESNKSNMAMNGVTMDISETISRTEEKVHEGMPDCNASAHYKPMSCDSHKSCEINFDRNTSNSKTMSITNNSTSEKDNSSMNDMSGMNMKNSKKDNSSMNDMGGMDMKDSKKDNSSMKDMSGMNMNNMSNIKMRPKWQSVILSTLHCGAGCSLADIVGEIITTLVPMIVGGSLIFGGWAFDYVLALIFGVYFQYFAIKQMNSIGLSDSKILKKAIHADFLSLTSWQLGMYGWMALVYFVFYAQTGIERLSWEFWFMMQIAMLCGFMTALPVNIWLIKKGIKSGM